MTHIVIISFVTIFSIIAKTQSTKTQPFVYECSSKVSIWEKAIRCQMWNETCMKSYSLTSKCALESTYTRRYY